MDLFLEMRKRVNISVQFPRNTNGRNKKRQRNEKMNTRNDKMNRNERLLKHQEIGPLDSDM